MKYFSKDRCHETVSHSTYKIELHLVSMALTRVALSGKSLGVQVTPTSRKKSFMSKKRASSERVEKVFIHNRLS